MSNLEKKYRALLGVKEPTGLIEKMTALLSKNRFYHELESGNLGTKPLNFFLASMGSGLVAALIYSNTFPNPFVLFAIFLNGMVIPFVLIKQRYIKSKMVESMRFKEFLETLTSEFTVGSSTSQAVANILKMRKLIPEIRDSFKRILQDIQLGVGVVDALKREKDSHSISKDLKVVLSVLIINHDSGSSDTIKGLQSIGLQMRDRTENLVDLKKAMAGIVGQRYIFFILVMVLPLLLGAQRDGYFTYTLNDKIGAIGLGLAYYISFLGQVIIDSVITKTTNKF